MEINAKRPYDSRLELDDDFIKINNIYTQELGVRNIS